MLHRAHARCARPASIAGNAAAHVHPPSLRGATAIDGVIGFDGEHINRYATNAIVRLPAPRTCPLWRDPMAMGERRRYRPAGEQRMGGWSDFAEAVKALQHLRGVRVRRRLFPVLALGDRVRVGVAIFFDDGQINVGVAACWARRRQVPTSGQTPGEGTTLSAAGSP